MLNRSVKIYITLIIASGLPFIAYSAFNMPLYMIIDVMIFGCFSALAESMPIYIVKDFAVSVAYAVDLMALFIFGPYGASLVASIGMIGRVGKQADGKVWHVFNMPYYKTLFNISQIALSIGTAGLIYKYTGGAFGTYVYPRYLLPALYAAVTYYILNTAFVALLLSFLMKKPLTYVLTNEIKLAVPDFIFLAFLGIVMSEAFVKIGYASLVLLFVPLFMIRYMFQLYMKAKESYYDTINVLIKSLEAKDAYTAGHSKSVERLSVILSRELGLSESHIGSVRIAALLHDVGKIGVKEEVLNKPGKLTDKEFSVIKDHPQKGYEILKDVPALKHACLWVKYHHEWYDGSGYPDGIKGEEIPLEAQILSLADVFDALVSDRPYRKAFTKDEAYKIIIGNEGTQFGPKVIKAFKNAFKRNKEEFRHDF